MEGGRVARAGAARGMQGPPETPPSQWRAGVPPQHPPVPPAQDQASGAGGSGSERPPPLDKPPGPNPELNPEANPEFDPDRRRGDGLERRIDPADGYPYTEIQFENQYKPMIGERWKASWAKAEYADHRGNPWRIRRRANDDTPTAGGGEYAYSPPPRTTPAGIPHGGGGADERETQSELPSPGSSSSQTERRIFVLGTGLKVPKTRAQFIEFLGEEIGLAEWSTAAPAAPVQRPGAHPPARSGAAANEPPDPSSTECNPADRRMDADGVFYIKSQWAEKFGEAGDDWDAAPRDDAESPVPPPVRARATKPAAAAAAAAGAGALATSAGKWVAGDVSRMTPQQIHAKLEKLDTLEAEAQKHERRMGRGTWDEKYAAEEVIRLRNERIKLEERRSWWEDRIKEEEEQLDRSRKAAEKARKQGLGFAPSKPGKEDGQTQPHWVCWNERDGSVHCFRCRGKNPTTSAKGGKGGKGKGETGFQCMHCGFDLDWQIGLDWEAGIRQLLETVPCPGHQQVSGRNPGGSSLTSKMRGKETPGRDKEGHAVDLTLRAGAKLWSLKKPRTNEPYREWQRHWLDQEGQIARRSVTKAASCQVQMSRWRCEECKDMIADANAGKPVEPKEVEECDTCSEMNKSKRFLPGGQNMMPVTMMEFRDLWLRDGPLYQPKAERKGGAAQRAQKEDWPDAWLSLDHAPKRPVFKWRWADLHCKEQRDTRTLEEAEAEALGEKHGWQPEQFAQLRSLFTEAGVVLPAPLQRFIFGEPGAGAMPQSRPQQHQGREEGEPPQQQDPRPGGGASAEPAPRKKAQRAAAAAGVSAVRPVRWATGMAPVQMRPFDLVAVTEKLWATVCGGCDDGKGAWYKKGTRGRVECLDEAGHACINFGDRRAARVPGAPSTRAWVDGEDFNKLGIELIRPFKLGKDELKKLELELKLSRDEACVFYDTPDCEGNCMKVGFGRKAFPAEPKLKLGSVVVCAGCELHLYSEPEGKGMEFKIPAGVWTTGRGFTVASAWAKRLRAAPARARAAAAPPPPQCPGLLALQASRRS